jgi:UDP-glucose 4-epimerase
LGEGQEVICLDNFYLGTRANIARLEGRADFVFHETDVSDLAALEAVCREERPDHIFHLAANSDIQASASDPVIEYRNTYTTTFNLLECARRLGIGKFFFASSSAIYGEREGAETAETCPPAPISYYGAAKAGSEELIRAYSLMNGMEALIFRFPNVIGSRLTHGVIFDFVAKLRRDPARLLILGDGRQAKPYMHVRDLITGIMMLREAAGVNVYNIGVNSQTAVLTIADIVCREMGLHAVSYEFSGGRGGWLGDVPVFAFDLTKIHATGWRATSTSTEAVERTVREVLA